MKKVLLALSAFIGINISTSAHAIDFSRNIEEVRCLATTIYREANGQPFDGQVAVAHVVMNRVQDSRFPSTICGVVYQPKQFSWAGKRNSAIPTPAYDRSRDIALGVLRGELEDPTDGALYFHNQTVRPSWSYRTTLLVRIGDHSFYA